MTSLEQLAHAVTSLPGVVAYCAVILIWALVEFIRFWSKLRPFRDELRRLCDILRDIKDEESFAARIDEVHEKIKESRLLAHQWLEFRETLISPARGDDATVLFNTESAAAYFSRDNLLGEHLNLRFYNALPNLLTGMGILGTFIGLVAGIYLAGSNLADPTRAQEALSSLLSGASLAFLTSIAGLTASILFSSGEKHLLHRFELLRQNWVAGLDRRLRRITLEGLVRDMLDENRKQSVVFSQFSEQLAFQLAAALENVIPRALDEKVAVPLKAAIMDLHKAVEDLARNQQRANEDTLRALVERFSETISGAAGTEMREFANTVNELSEKLDGLIVQIAKQQEEVRRQSQASVEKLTKTFQQGAEGLQDKVEKSVDQILTGLSTTVGEMSSALSGTVNRMSGDLEKTATAFTEAAGGLAGSVESIRGILTKTQELVEYQDQLIASARRVHSQLEHVARGIGDAGKATEAAGEKIAQAASQAQAASTALKAAFEGFTRHQAALERMWKQYEERFSGLDESLAGTFRQIEQGLERYAQLVNEFITELDGHTGKITSMLAGAVQELNESVEDLSETLSERNP